ncbi:MAG: DUF4834 family protein [Bacteroidetes bacterium]|nr:DUF4834 family protein [Bacteroidota bacterium]
MLGLLRIFLIVLLVYYIIKIIARIFFPILFKKVVKNAEERMRNQQSKYTNQQSSNSKVGETVIEKKPTPPKSDNKVGEYIDYEEIE